MLPRARSSNMSEVQLHYLQLLLLPQPQKYKFRFSIIYGAGSIGRLRTRYQSSLSRPRVKLSQMLDRNTKSQN